MSDVIAPLEQLPQTTQALMAATLKAAATTLTASEDRIHSEPLHRAALWAVRKTALDLRFLIARDGEEVLFFFVKRQLPTAIALSVRLRVVIEAHPPASPLEPNRPAIPGQAKMESSDRAQHQLRIPPFLWLKPDAAALSLYAPPESTSRRAVLFRVGTAAQSVLAIRDPEDARKAMLCLTPVGKPVRPLPVRAAEPFLLLAETLRDWLLSSMSTATLHEVRIPENPSQQTDVHVTLHWFVESFLAMERASPSPDIEARGSLNPRYLVSCFQAELQLAVDDSGLLATEKTKTRTELGMRLRLTRERGQLRALIDLLPPDFLCSGPLRESFLTALEARCRRGGPPLPQLASGDAWSSFLSSARSRAVVLRTGKTGAHDQEVFILPGTCGEKPRTVLVRAVAQVDTRPQTPQVALSQESIAYDSFAPTPQLLDEEITGYFLRLSASLRDWLRLLS